LSFNKINLRMKSGEQTTDLSWEALHLKSSIDRMVNLPDSQRSLKAIAKYIKEMNEESFNQLSIDLGDLTQNIGPFQKALEERALFVNTYMGQNITLNLDFSKIISVKLTRNNLHFFMQNQEKSYNLILENLQIENNINRILNLAPIKETLDSFTQYVKAINEEYANELSKNLHNLTQNINKRIAQLGGVDQYDFTNVVKIVEKKDEYYSFTTRSGDCFTIPAWIFTAQTYISEVYNPFRNTTYCILKFLLSYSTHYTLPYNGLVNLNTFCATLPDFNEIRKNIHSLPRSADATISQSMTYDLLVRAMNHYCSEPLMDFLNTICEMPHGIDRSKLLLLRPVKKLRTSRSWHEMLVILLNAKSIDAMVFDIITNDNITENDLLKFNPNFYELLDKSYNPINMLPKLSTLIKKILDMRKIISPYSKMPAIDYSSIGDVLQYITQSNKQLDKEQ
jgi:hypothetical protein